MRRVVIGLGLVAAVAPVHAETVEPTKLAAIDAKAKGSGEQTSIYTAGVDADVLLFALGGTDFVMVADAKPVDGRLEEVPASAAFDALAVGRDVVRLRRTPGARTDVARLHADPLEVLRGLAEVQGQGYVFAPQHVLPRITVRAARVDPTTLARTIAKLVGLELIASHGVWVVAEPGTKLDPKVAAATHAKSRLAIDHAHPGEARRLIEPDEPDDRNLCPKDTLVDANLHGQVGVLEAVLSTLAGPACEQQPTHTELDTGTATLVGILIEPKLRRAVFRVPHGARTFEPDDGQGVEIDHVIVKGDTTLYRTGSRSSPAPGPFDDPQGWRLHGTVHVGKRWSAIFRSKAEWRVVAGTGDTKVEITAGTAAVKPRTYTLER